MNTLKVTCKPKDGDSVREVTTIDFQWKEVFFSIPENDWLQGYSFNNIEWIDFGATRWYPNNL